MKKCLALLLAMIMIVFSMTACENGKSGANDSKPQAGNEENKDDKENEEAASPLDTLVIGTQRFDGIFSSLFSNSAYDAQVNDLVFTSISRLDENGDLIDWAGHIESEEITAEDGHTQVKYTVSIQEGMKFTDGEPVTIDDVIWLYYVMADPNYDGRSNFSTLDIVGLREYYYDTPNYTALIQEAENKYSRQNITREDFISYLIATNLNGWFTGELPGDADGSGMSWADYLDAEGYDTEGISTADQMLEKLAECEYDHYASDYDPLSYYKQQIVLGSMEDGVDVETISGIQRVDDYTCTVLLDSISITAEKTLAWQPIMPEHYYGKEWKKGDLSSIKELNDKPLGNGPYILKEYKNNLVTMDANPDYFKGEPKIPHIKLQVVNEEDKADLIISGDIDITNPQAEIETLEQLDNADYVERTLVDNPGYGYIAINAESVPDLNVRKGLMHLMNRAPAVNTYYGELGTVIERPMTPTLAEYPKDAKEYYGYDTAKALEYFKQAGYEQMDGKLVKDGKQLVIHAGIGDSKSHPCTPILTQMANDMEAMGAQLIVNDLEFTVLSTMVKAGELDMWVRAWGNTTSCDLTSIFGSRGSSNEHRYYDPQIDQLQAQILQTMDFEERCGLVEKELDMIMDAAIYMPVYQRKNMEAYNGKNVNIATLPERTTTYWNYVANIEVIEMN